MSATRAEGRRGAKKTPKPEVAEESDEETTTARRAANKSYKEDSDSAHSEGEAPVVEKQDKDFSAEESASESEEEGSDWGGESSGSEYGKKKKKVTPAKGKGTGRGRGRPPASPKGKGRGRGKAPAAKNGRKAVKRGRKADSDDESESEADSSGSEYGKKKISPKKKTPAKASPKAKVTPRRKAAAAKRSPSPEEDSGRARRGRPSASKSYREMSEDDIEEVSEEEKPKKRAKLEPKEKPKKAESEKNEEGSASEDQSMEEDDEEVDEKVEKKKDGAKKNGTDNNVEMKEEKNGTAEHDDEKSENGDMSPAPSPSEDASDGKGEEKTLVNRTDTDYATIKFEPQKKTTASGDEWNFKISCWNIGGIKSWLKKNGLKYLDAEDPDIMCLNEVKCNDKTKPAEIAKLEKYPNQYWSFNEENSGHSGVAIFSKKEPLKVTYGLPEGEDDEKDDKKSKSDFSKEGRMITLEYDDFFLINTYVPNGGRAEKSEKYPKGYPPKVADGVRQKFDKFFAEHVKQLEKKKPVIVTGDLNVAHNEIDLANPKTNERTAGFTKEEREDFSSLLDDTTLFDTFRELYPDQKGAYTFWSYMHNSRQKNTGWRLDYFLMSEKLKASLVDSVMRKDVYGSDHCPIVLFLHN